MNRDIANGCTDRELRRRQLAVRLIGHRARTRTLTYFTGLTCHQLGYLRRRGGVPTHSRFRGSAHTSFDDFFSPARTRNESAVLALLYCMLGASKFEKPVGSLEAAMARGEQLCEIFETWRRLVPSSHFEFEQLMLLGEGVTRGDQISFGHCGSCRALILIDRLGTQRSQCHHCICARREDLAPSRSGQLSEDEETDLVLYSHQLLGGQLLNGHNGSYSIDDGSFPP